MTNIENIRELHCYKKSELSEEYIEEQVNKIFAIVNEEKDSEQ